VEGALPKNVIGTGTETGSMIGATGLLCFSSSIAFYAWFVAHLELYLYAWFVVTCLLNCLMCLYCTC
jgi:hypothetical protein